ncbi:MULTISPECIES: M15 family metallopeptidase [unclassified Acinetobacter]|uniref:M15 family metallopeptidase n=1 Tax=unclassified Acinetobacter TaxID=196816 RepID=UPI0028826738|nr:MULTISPECIES: M15 family metallopeptidase [unclassified Acinetobacter]MDT0200010.1 M15 family metallopeptidase [Acinetobacter sp. RG5]MDT0231444.1 M15 family metallopeptidase [Acinetobacter sp. RRD8]
MILIILSSFILLSLAMLALLSYEFRLRIQDFFLDLIPQSKQQFSQVKHFVQKFYQAASPEHIQSEWYLQQWWILIAGFSLFGSILIFAFTQPLTASKFEAEYLRKVDPQIYALLDGQILTAPTEVDEQLIIEALQEEVLANHSVISAQSLNLNIEDIHINPNISTADRKWHKMNPRFKQRLLMVFKIMREQHGYELVLLEGYRSPERQNSLATNSNITKAKGFQSYHQFGLAADIAFKRDGKVVISERDPWAMRGYELYGQIAESVGLTWGGRWKSIKDFGHTEYRMPGLKKTAAMAHQLIHEGQLQTQSFQP